MTMPPGPHPDDLDARLAEAVRIMASPDWVPTPPAPVLGQGGVFDPDAPAGRRWCGSADHHEWLHMLLDRAKADLSSAYAAWAERSAPGWTAGQLAQFREEMAEVVKKVPGMSSAIPSDYCRRCDVYIGYGGAGVAKIPKDHADDPAWLRSHCWVCLRSREEIASAGR